MFGSGDGLRLGLGRANVLSRGAAERQDAIYYPDQSLSPKVGEGLVRKTYGNEETH